eukprot:1545262-Prymnesium_polylepis.1
MSIVRRGSVSGVDPFRNISTRRHTDRAVTLSGSLFSNTRGALLCVPGSSCRDDGALHRDELRAEDL